MDWGNHYRCPGCSAITASSLTIILYQTAQEARFNQLRDFLLPSDQVGDQLDRGNDEVRILYFLERLEREAEKAGGKLHILNGNHETMNVAGRFTYATLPGLADFYQWQLMQSWGSALKVHIWPYPGLLITDTLFVCAPYYFLSVRQTWRGCTSFSDGKGRDCGWMEVLSVQAKCGCSIADSQQSVPPPRSSLDNTSAAAARRTALSPGGITHGMLPDQHSMVKSPHHSTQPTSWVLDCHTETGQASLKRCL